MEPSSSIHKMCSPLGNKMYSPQLTFEEAPGGALILCQQVAGSIPHLGQSHLHAPQLPLVAQPILAHLQHSRVSAVRLERDSLGQHCSRHSSCLLRSCAPVQQPSSKQLQL